jgi:glyoxylase-like metal-dependent hydrolase (beta-lactamase superfamily II)
MQQLTERVWVAPGGVNIGVVRAGDGGVILIDTGLNDTAARKVLRWVRDELQGHVTSIVTTHGHADHFGGNAFVVKRTGARVFAPAWDEVMLRYPLMQAVMLYAGADPPASMRGAFLVAEPSPVDEMYAAGPLTISGVAFTAISLAGHSPNQMGVLVDGVFFCADIVLPERVLEKYRMPYLYSLSDHLRSLEHALDIEHTVAVPGHGPLLGHVSEGIVPNRQSIDEVSEMVIDACREPRMPEDVLAIVLERLGSDAGDAPSYYLLHPTIFAYLSHFERAGVLSHTVERGRSVWQRI